MIAAESASMGGRVTLIDPPEQEIGVVRGALWPGLGRLIRVQAGRQWANQLETPTDALVHALNRPP